MFFCKNAYKMREMREKNARNCEKKCEEKNMEGKNARKNAGNVWKIVKTHGNPKKEN